MDAFCFGCFDDARAACTALDSESASVGNPQLSQFQPAAKLTPAEAIRLRVQEDCRFADCRTVGSCGSSTVEALALLYCCGSDRIYR